VDINDFRYDGPKPQTAEAAILMLSDTVEAAVRSIPEPTQAKISAMITKLVRGKMEDGQLDECTLTFRDIGKICKAYENVLKGVFHERIEYPSVDLNRPKRNHGNRSGRKPMPQRNAQPKGTENKPAEKKAAPSRPAQPARSASAQKGDKNAEKKPAQQQGVKPVQQAKLQQKHEANVKPEQKTQTAREEKPKQEAQK